MIEAGLQMMWRRSRLSLMKKLGHAKERWVPSFRCVVQFPSSGLKKLRDLVQNLILSVRIFSYWILYALSQASFKFILCHMFSFLTSVQRYDPTYQATKLHFEDLANRYGNPIIVLNLIKVFSLRHL